MLTVGQIQLGYMRQTGQPMSEGDYTSFIDLCVTYNLLDCDSYDEAQELMLLQLKRRPFQNNEDIEALANQIKEKHHA